MGQRLFQFFTRISIKVAGILALFNSSLDPSMMSTTIHEQIVNYLIQLKELATFDSNTDIRLFQFPEVKQNWLGLCKWGNNGRGLGPKFARDLIKAFNGFQTIPHRFQDRS